MKIQEATYISLIAVAGKESELRDLLIDGARIVEATEPDTLLWFALESDDNSFVIFDVFPNDLSRDAHFAGKVANILAQRSTDLVQGGLNEGIADNIENSSVLFAKIPFDTPDKIEEATFIRLTAKKDKESELANFLVEGGKLVTEFEPATVYWFALQIDDQTFAIIDFFPDCSGRDAHFAGDVAAALEVNSPELVEGGWEEGVKANIKNFKVLNAKLINEFQLLNN